MIWEKLQNAQKRSERGWKTPCIGRPWQGFRRPVVNLNVFLATEIFQAPDPRGVLQQGARDVPAKIFGFRVSTFTHGQLRAPRGGGRALS